MAPVDIEEGEEATIEDIKSFFKARSSSENLADFSLKTTLGQGTFGRVRLAESPAAKEKLRGHSGFFAIKILKKSEIIRLKQNDHVKAEHGLLNHKLSHPFIVNAYGTYKDERNLYLIEEFVPGGEVLAQSRKDVSKLENDNAKFFAAQLVMALQYLHADNIIFRGLVPDNLLIDRAGYIKLVDFGYAKRLPVIDEVVSQTFTLCGTAEYLAPEIVNSKGHGKGADWWALGCVVYEMLAGYPPFYASNPFEIYQQILKAVPNYPSHFDINLHEGVQNDGKPAIAPASAGTGAAMPRTGLICRLLQKETTKRIGCLKNGAEDIKKHKWFRGLNWAALYNKQMPPPAPGAPDLQDDEDTHYFPTYPDSVEESGPLLDPAKQAMYDYW